MLTSEFYSVYIHHKYELIYGAKMKLQNGILKTISDKTGISVQELSDYAATRKRPGRKRLELLIEASGVQASVWLFSDSEQIKSDLAANNAQ